MHISIVKLKMYIHVHVVPAVLSATSHDVARFDVSMDKVVCTKMTQTFSCNRIPVSLTQFHVIGVHTVYTSTSTRTYVFTTIPHIHVHVYARIHIHVHVCTMYRQKGKSL